MFWSLVEHTLTRDEHWATQVRDHVLDRCGRNTPERDAVTRSADQAPAVADWSRRGACLGAVAESLDAAEPVEPAEPPLSANAIGIDASAEPTPRAIANAPTRPT